MNQARIVYLMKKILLHGSATVLIVLGIIILFIPFIPGTPIILIGLSIIINDTGRYQDWKEKSKLYKFIKFRFNWLGSKIY
jgi:uncharacterized membrane protein YbaN (DUF454 family)